MALNVNFSPLNFRELNLRKPTGAEDFVEGIGYIKEGNEKRRKRSFDESLGDILDDESAIDAELAAIDKELKELGAE